MIESRTRERRLVRRDHCDSQRDDCVPAGAQVRKIGEEYFTYLVDCEDPKVRAASVSAATGAPRRRRTVESHVR